MSSRPHPLTILLVVACTVTSSLACSCSRRGTWEEAVNLPFRKGTSGFAIKMKVKDAIGPMILNPDSTMTLTDDPNNSKTLYHIDIEEVFKESPEYLAATKVLITTNSDGMCGVKFEPGKSYKITGSIGKLSGSDLRYLTTNLCHWKIEL